VIVLILVILLTNFLYLPGIKTKPFFMNNNQPVQFATIFAIAFLLASCSSNEIGLSKDVNQETIYQEYRLEYGAQEKEALLFAQFRFAGENGTTLVLTAPAQLEYNGSVLKVDSNGFSGAYYSSAVPLKKVIGLHTLVFTDGEKRKYTNSFTIDSFSVGPVPATVSKYAPALLPFKAPALHGEDYIELNSEGTDSSFSVKYTVNEKGNYITIPVSELQRQKGNELLLVPTLYRKFKLQQQTKEGGEITTVQTLLPIKLTLLADML
jgi:hypothetical protein